MRYQISLLMRDEYRIRLLSRIAVVWAARPFGNIAIGPQAG